MNGGQYVARITVKELQEQLKKSDDIIKWQQQKIQELQEQNEKILNDKDSVSKAEYKALSKQFQNLQDNYNEMKDFYEHERTKNTALIGKCMGLEKELSEIKPKHNARGAGRKSTLTEEQVNKIKELHKQGLSYGAIAKEVGFSKAYVYKLISFEP